MNPSQNLGKSSEMLISSMLLAENRETYIPCVDDHGVDLIVRTKNFISGDGTKPDHYEFQEIQIKSVSKGGLFAAMTINPRPNYWFVFYIRDINKIWLFNSIEIVNYKKLNQGFKSGDPGYIGASQNTDQTKKNVGKWSLDLTPTKKSPIKSANYLITNFVKLP